MHDITPGPSLPLPSPPSADTGPACLRSDVLLAQDRSWLQALARRHGDARLPGPGGLASSEPRERPGSEGSALSLQSAMAPLRSERLQVRETQKAEQQPQLSCQNEHKSHERKQSNYLDKSIKKGKKEKGEGKKEARCKK